MNPAHYLRIEGVNLSAFVFDTRDLSTNRGGSLMLLDAVDKAREALGLGEDDPNILSRGASSGLFRIEGEPEAAATKVRKALAREFPHATFVVDVITADFAKARESLLAANRWRQMQAATLAVPDAVTGNGAFPAKPACALDGLRPADSSMPAPNRRDEEEAFISLPTHERREYGRTKKQDFYQDASGLTELPDFAHDFETISAGSKPLDGKLAVFYADGNGFGGIQARHCQSPDEQRNWDDLVRGARKEFLRSFLHDEIGVGDGKAFDAESPWRGIQQNNRDKGKQCVRFETLLWGGDEFMFVMPAALGWRFAALFFDKMRGKSFADETLTHAAALVFCQHHSPIHRLQRLAKEQMAEFAKGAKDENGIVVGRSRDSLMVVALESFDHLGTDFEKAMAKRYSETQPLEKMILAPVGGRALHEVLDSFAGGVANLRGSESFPRSQLRGLVGEMLAKHDLSIGKLQSEKDANGNPKPPRHFRNADDGARATLAGLLPLFPDPATLWLQLEELWDYALP